MESNAIVPNETFEGMIAYDIFAGKLLYVRAELKVLAPTISAAGALPTVTVTLATAEVGAAIYFTTDGTFPSEENEAATLYTTPFIQAAAATVRAAAYLAGKLGSDITQKIIT